MLSRRPPPKVAPQPLLPPWQQRGMHPAGSAPVDCATWGRSPHLVSWVGRPSPTCPRCILSLAIRAEVITPCEPSQQRCVTLARLSCCCRGLRKLTPKIQLSPWQQAILIPALPYVLIGMWNNCFCMKLAYKRMRLSLGWSCSVRRRHRGRPSSPKRATCHLTLPLLTVTTLVTFSSNNKFADAILFRKIQLNINLKVLTKRFVILYS